MTSPDVPEALDELAEPDSAPTEPAEDAGIGEAPGPAWTSWRYVGDIARVYAHIPVTVVHGDVISHFGLPAADGNWDPTDAEPTKRPDNWRPDPLQEA